MKLKLQLTHTPMTHVQKQCCLDDADFRGGRGRWMEGRRERKRKVERESERDTDTRSSHVCVYMRLFSHYVSDTHAAQAQAHIENLCVCA